LQRIGEEAFVEVKLKGTVVLPRSIGVLSCGCFLGCQLLETVIFESGSVLREIGEYAFGGSGLMSIVIPASVRVIGRIAFKWCTSLESVTFESGSELRNIGEDAFAVIDQDMFGVVGMDEAALNQLKNIIIPASVEVIGTGAFLGCKLLEIVIFESGSVLREIGEYAFEGSGLKSIVIPASVK
jgi:hypothetical protein